MGLCIAKEAGIKKLIVMGDLMIIIRSIVTHVAPESYALSSLILRNKNLISSFDYISFFHIKREFNGHANHWAKVVSSLSLGTLLINGGI
jgi:hypothetical protein